MSRGGLARSIAARVLALLAALLAVFLVVGLLLPRRVEVTRSLPVPAAPEAIFPYLEDLEAWTEWTPWGEVESEVQGHSSGPGATRIWDDPAFGSGSLTLLEVERPVRVTYRAVLEDGGIRFEGELRVEPTESGATVIWTEAMGWGWNPLLGWTSLGLEGSQGRQLGGALVRLRDVVVEDREPAASPPVGGQGR